MFALTIAFALLLLFEDELELLELEDEELDPHPPKFGFNFIHPVTVDWLERMKKGRRAREHVGCLKETALKGFQKRKCPRSV